MLRICLAATAGFAALSGAAFAQDYTLEPTYGSVSLNSGFTPDPHTVSLQSGGSIDAQAAFGGSCRGYIADAPDFSLNYSAEGTFPLIISVNASADTALVVNGPDGSWYCDDDSGEGLNPSIRFNAPGSGRYDIWVATYGNASLEPATLYISEVASQ